MSEQVTANDRVPLEDVLDSPFVRHVERIQQLRREYSRANTKWMPTEDLLLLALSAEGTSVAEIAEQLRRSGSAIRARLHKFGLSGVGW